jgi:hypothetical protein
MDEAGVVKQTTIEQVIRTHQLSAKGTVCSKNIAVALFPRGWLCQANG